MKRLFFLILLCSFSVRAQAPFVQGGGHNYAPDADWQHEAANYSWSFANPLNAQGNGCTILVVIREPNWNVTDSQGNVFVRLDTQAPMLWYSKTCSAGPDIVSITNTNAGQPDWVEFAVGEYAGVWVPKNISVPIANYCCTTNAWSNQITADAGDLLIGIGANHTTDNPVITAGTGWTLRANYNAFFEDSVATVSGPITSTATYSVSTDWCQSIVSFSKVGIVLPPHKAVLTWQPSTSSGASYNIYRGTGPSCTMALLANTSATTFTDTTIVPGNGYCYQVKTLANGQESDSPFICAALTVQ